MNNKNIFIIVTLLILIVGGLVYNQLNQDSGLDASLIKLESELVKDDPKLDKIVKPKLDDALLHIAQMISPPSDADLKQSWEDEYTCNQAEKCSTFIFNARSYEDALWLKRKGYPTRTNVALLGDVSKKDLWDLSENGNVNAKNLLAIDALQHKNYKKAKSYARSSTAHTSHATGTRETFGYRLLAEALLLEENPMVATLYLRMASILGDTNATATYERITANSASLMIDNTNRIAYGHLLSMLNTDMNNLNNDPRPRVNGGGG